MKEYNKFTLEEFTKVFYETLSSQPKNKLQLTTGYDGCINYLDSFFKQLGHSKPKEELKDILDNLANDNIFGITKIDGLYLIQ